MDQKNIKKRKVLEFNEFKKEYEKTQAAGDKKRTVEEKDLSKAHPGYNKIKAEGTFTRHDSNPYKAFGIEVNPKDDNTNNYVKAKLTLPEVKEDKEMEEIQNPDEDYAGQEGSTGQGDGISEKKINPYAICTKSIGKKEGTQKRSKWSKDAEKRYERCKKHLEENKK